MATTLTAAGSAAPTASAEPATSVIRSALRELAGAVSIVATGAPPDRAGFAATSVGLLSIAPPRIILSSDRASSADIARHRCFGVSILADHHEALVARFGSGDIKGEARFAGECWHTLTTGAPLLCDALAAIDCELEELIERHSHVIAIGRVVGVFERGVGDALVRWRGDYHRLSQASHEQAIHLWSPILPARDSGFG